MVGMLDVCKFALVRSFPATCTNWQKTLDDAGVREEYPQLMPMNGFLEEMELLLRICVEMQQILLMHEAGHLGKESHTYRD